METGGFFLVLRPRVLGSERTPGGPPCKATDSASWDQNLASNAASRSRRVVIR